VGASGEGFESGSGTVTFLFTDIEGSTRRWQADRSAMEDALAVHDRVLRDSVDRWRGRVVKHTGDGIMAVFASANDAVAAAAEAQEHLTLPVRMGVHTGEAQERDGDFFGPALNRAARIMEAGHGGQVLVSESTASVLDGADLVDLGSHRLKDLLRLERLWQVGEGSFAPLRVVDRVSGNVPLERAELFGRSEMTAAVAEHLATGRLLSLVGVGGVGKTSVALAVAGAVQDEYPDGVWFVELAPIGEPDNVVPVIAGVFGRGAPAGVTLRDSLLDLLASKELLLVLDNCEHLVDEVAALVESLLEVSSTVDVLITSREGLGVAGEQQVTVSSLPADAVDSAAIQLFVARARQLDPEFGLDESTIDDVIGICRSLDGIPLAIELAATRVRTLAPSEIRERLSDRFRLLSAGRRRVVERHQTLRHTVQWSYELLDDLEQTVLNRLSVFAGGCTLAAIETVCADGLDALELVDVVDSLVAKSLVVADRRSAMATRYRLLETIRQFAEEELHAAGEAMVLRSRFDGYMLETLCRLSAEGNEPDSAMYRWIDDEFDNLRAAFESSIIDDLDAATMLASVLASNSWIVLRYENLEWPERVLDARGDEADDVPAELLGASIWEPAFAGDPALARTRAERALTLARRHPPQTSSLEPWMGVVSEAIMSGDADRVLAVAAEITATDGIHPVVTTVCRFYETWAHLMRGDRDASRAAAERYEPELRAGLGGGYFADWALARLETDPLDALARYERATDQAIQLGAKFIVMALEREVGQLHRTTGRPRAAMETLTPLCEHWYAANEITDWASILCILAPTFAALGDWNTTTLLLAALEDKADYAINMAGMQASELDELTTRARTELSDAAFEHEYRSGTHATNKEVMDRLRSATSRLLAAHPATSS
jgi:predicted ATPase/class 3 adenylate cyclase